MIAVIDYEAGNAPSVVAALRHIGYPGSLISTARELEEADRIILPGVGSAAATMASLRDLGLIDQLGKRIRAGVPFLGVCVGLQVLFEHSDEGNVECLSYFAGRVKRFPSGSLRVPQIGWNSANALRHHPLLEGVPNPSHFYFVNSYYVVPTDESLILTEAQYGVRFAAMIAQGNVLATQFHVEKSGPVGLRILQNFVEMPKATAPLRVS